MTRNIHFRVVLMYLLAFSTVSAEETTISASACAKQSSDGTVVKCDVSSETSRRLDDSLHAMQLINKTYPGPEGPNLTDLHEVVGVDDSGRITTREGLVLMPAGVKCNTEMIQYLRSTFLKRPGTKLAFMLNGEEVGDIKYAYLWDVWDMPDDKTTSEAVQFGPFFGSVNESGVTSHFCIPVQQKNHRYHERYKALAKWK